MKKKTLKDYIDQVEEEVRGTKQIRPGFPAKIGDRAVIVHAILERTAVVYPEDHPHDRFLVQLGVLKAEEQEIKWIPKSTTEQRVFLSGNKGRKSALDSVLALAKEKVAEAVKKQDP